MSDSQVVVTTAFPLEKKQKEKVLQIAQKVVGATTAELKEVIDPTVLGGIKITFGGVEYDATLSSKLTVVQQQLQAEMQ